MHNFKYEDGGEFITWSCEWDGEGESPLTRTRDYFDAVRRHKRLASMLKPGEDSLEINHDPLRTLEDDGTISMSDPFSFIYTRDEIEALQPDLIREVNCICASNAITRAMCEMLSLTHEQIEGGYSGNTEGGDYFRSVLGCLSDLWD